jgi:hypothetical protein
MKKILSVFLMIGVVAGTASANDNEMPNATSGVAVVSDGATFRLYYRGTDKNNVKISIRNEEDDIVYSEVIRKSTGFVRPYNFSKLPEGKYTIEIEDNSGTQLESVMYRRAGVDRLAHLQKVAGSQRYVLSLPGKASGEVSIRIFDANSALIYNKSEYIAGDFAKMYNLEKFEGRFMFEITDTSGNATTISY